MALFLDTSALVAILLNQPEGARARSFLASRLEVTYSSDFAAAEFASAASRLVRMREIGARQARAAFEAFDIWTSGPVHLEPLTGADIAEATRYLRRLDLTLRAPDGLHIATAARLQAELVTLDRRMADCARVLGVAAVEP